MPGKRSRTDRILAKRGGTPRANDAAASDAVDDAAGSSGAPLPDVQRSAWERSLDTDLSGVRVHTGATSAEAADSIGARAYAVGQDIHFGAGEYAPGTSGGDQLLAHEVAHTVQQAGAPAAAPQTKLEVSAPGDTAEVEADAAAEAMVSGAPAHVSTAPPSLARDVKEQPKKEPIEGSIEHEVGLWTPIDKTVHCGYVDLRWSAGLVGAGKVSMHQEDEPKEAGPGAKKKSESPLGGFITSLVSKHWPPDLEFESGGFAIHDWQLVSSENDKKEKEFKLLSLTFYKGSVKNRGMECGDVTLSVAGLDIELKHEMEAEFLPITAGLSVELLKLSSGGSQGPCVAESDVSLAMKLSFQAALNAETLLERITEYGFGEVAMDALLAVPPAAAVAAVILMGCLWAESGNETNQFHAEIDGARAVAQATANLALGKDIYDGVNFQDAATTAAVQKATAEIQKAGAAGKKQIDDKLAALTPQKRAAVLADPQTRDSLYRDIFFPLFRALKEKWTVKFAGDPVLSKAVKATGDGSEMMDWATFEGEASAQYGNLSGPAPWYESWLVRKTSALKVSFEHALEHVGFIAEYASQAACVLAPERDREQGHWPTSDGGGACWLDDHGTAYEMRLHDGGIIARYQKLEDAKKHADDGGVWDSNGKNPLPT